MKRRQTGAALLLAMVILTLVATAAAGMIWQQTRAVQVEAAERARAQAGWILTAGLDFSRLILREDRRTNDVDDLTEIWAQDVGESRLSTLLAADREHGTDDGPDAFLAGRIVDAQSRYNLRNLIDAKGKIGEVELRALDHLCEAAGVPSDTAQRIADGLRLAWVPGADEGSADGAPLAPKTVDQLGWLGIEPEIVRRLAPFLVILPRPTPVNANTASREVLLAAVDGLDLATAERLVQARQRRPFATLDEIAGELPQGLKTDKARVSVNSGFFEIDGRLRIDDRVIEERSLVERRGPERGLEVLPLQRERHAGAAGTP